MNNVNFLSAELPAHIFVVITSYKNPSFLLRLVVNLTLLVSHKLVECFANGGLNTHAFSLLSEKRSHGRAVTYSDFWFLCLTCAEGYINFVFTLFYHIEYQHFHRSHHCRLHPDVLCRDICSVLYHSASTNNTTLLRYKPCLITCTLWERPTVSTNCDIFYPHSRKMDGHEDAKPLVLYRTESISGNRHPVSPQRHLPPRPNFQIHKGSEDSLGSNSSDNKEPVSSPPHRNPRNSSQQPVTSDDKESSSLRHRNTGNAPQSAPPSSSPVSPRNCQANKSNSGQSSPSEKGFPHEVINVKSQSQMRSIGELGTEEQVKQFEFTDIRVWLLFCAILNSNCWVFLRCRCRSVSSNYKAW